MTREDLKDYRNNQRWIQGRLEYIEEYKTSIEKITTTLSDMPMGGKQVQDSMAEKIATLLDNCDYLLNTIVKYQEKQKDILKQLDKVEQPYRLVLEKNYIQGKSLVTIASEENYNYDYVKHINGIALLKFDDLNET